MLEPRTGYHVSSVAQEGERLGEVQTHDLGMTRARALVTLDCVLLYYNIITENLIAQWRGGEGNTRAVRATLGTVAPELSSVD